MTAGLHIATQVTSALAAVATVLATTDVFPLELIVPVFVLLQVGVFVFLLIASSLPALHSVRVRMVTFITVEANLAFLGVSRGQLSARLGIGAWWQQMLVAFITWSIVVGGVLTYAIDIQTLVPYLLGQRGSSGTTTARLEARDEEEKARWGTHSQVPSNEPPPLQPLSPRSPRGDDSPLLSPISTTEFTSPFSEEQGRFSQSSSWFCSYAQS
ncbi:hypothetical protein RQP46_010107 [Phenoliferia psychrophenolica]